MNIGRVEAKVFVSHVITVQVYYCDDQTLLGKLSEPVNASEEVSDAYTRRQRRVEDGLALDALLLD